MTRKGRKSQSRRGIVVAPKSAPLSFRQKAKSRSAPLCLLLPTRPTPLGSCWVPILTILPLKRTSTGKIGTQMEPSEAGPFGRGGAKKRSETWPSGRGERCGLCPDDGPPIGCTPGASDCHAVCIEKFPLIRRLTPPPSPQGKAMVNNHPTPQQRQSQSAPPRPDTHLRRRRKNVG